MNEKQLQVLDQLRKVAAQYQVEFGHRLPITGEIGELLVCEKLGLIKVAKTNNPGFDAFDRGGQKYQIKTAVFTEKEYDKTNYAYMKGRNMKTNRSTVMYRNASFSQIKPGDWDEILFCVVDTDFNIMEIWSIEQEELFEHPRVINMASFKAGTLRINIIREICYLYYEAEK